MSPSPKPTPLPTVFCLVGMAIIVGALLVMALLADMVIANWL
jgi:hypothetical protein